MDLLIRDEDRAPRLLIDECMRRGDAMIEQLAAVVGQDRYWIDAGGHLESWLPLRATMISGLVPGERAGLLLVSLMRRMAANFGYLYGGKPVEVRSAAGVRGILTARKCWGCRKPRSRRPDMLKWIRGQ